MLFGGHCKISDGGPGERSQDTRTTSDQSIMTRTMSTSTTTRTKGSDWLSRPGSTSAGGSRPAHGGGTPAFASTDGAHEDQGRILAHETERRLAERASCGESHRYNYNAELVVGVVDTARANYDSGQERVPELEPVEAMGPI